MDGRPLDHIELLSLAHKDEQYYQQWIGNDIQELAQRILGVRKWIQFRNVITVLSRLGFFAMTTLSNITTPGEEFCEAKPIWQPYENRLAMILLNNEFQLPAEFPKPYAKLVKDIHYITFFLFGDFFELAKRVTNYSYLADDTSSPSQSRRLTNLYRLLGVMSIVRLFMSVSDIAKEANLMTTSKNENIKESSTDATKKLEDPNTICHLCSEARSHPTSTVCGHIFCWNCIHQWLKDRAECPICRTPTEPSRLIYLVNFR